MIGIACDHTGNDLKEAIIAALEEEGAKVKDFGCERGERVDYPVYGYRVAQAVASGECEKGILICGTGVGISLAANKVKGIRAVVCSEPYSALLSKQHNDANILALGARVVGTELAKMIIKVWLEGEFLGGKHAKRVEMIRNIEQGVLEVERKGG